jgi:hypothetical protein
MPIAAAARALPAMKRHISTTVVVPLSAASA